MTEKLALNRSIQIGEAAQRAGVTPGTLRFYETEGLMRTSDRAKGRHRSYSEEELRRIARIVELRGVVGLSVEETKRLIDAEDALDDLRNRYLQETDAEVRREELTQAIWLIDQQEPRLADKIARIDEMRSRWRATLDRCRDHLAQVERIDRRSARASKR